MVAKSAVSESSAADHLSTQREVERAASVDVPVLVSAIQFNERITYARLVHACSDRSEHPFIELQCGSKHAAASTANELTLDVLAASFRDARGGSLFIDDVGELSVTCQSWLCRQLSLQRLRQLETGRGVRLIAGSSGTLLDHVSIGRFDSYLFYRLNVIHIDRR
jgi:two-component system response regulator PilR (NtrC family)